MASLRIHKGEVTAEHLLEEVSREDWPKLLRERRWFVRVSVPKDCRELIRFREEADRMYEPLGYATVEDFLREELELDPQVVEWAVAGLQTLTDEERAKEQPLPVMADRGKRLAATMAKAEPTRPVEEVRKARAEGGKKGGRPRKDEPRDKPSLPGNEGFHGEEASAGGNRSAYLASRIKAAAAKDPKAASVAAKVEAGEYTSMRAAARDAGVIKPPDPIRDAARSITKVPTHRLAELVAALPEHTARALATCLRDRVGGAK